MIRSSSSPKGAYFTLGRCDTVLVCCSIVLLIIVLVLIVPVYAIQIENRALLQDMLELMNSANDTALMLADAAYQQHVAQMGSIQRQQEAFAGNL